MSKKLTTNDFIKKAKILHQDKYDYSNVEYINAQTKILIICKYHGEFYQRSGAHLYNNAGCPECSKTKLTTNEFIKNAKLIHKDYDYSQVEYINMNTLVKIRCKKHGIFEKRPTNHIHRKQGCQQCQKILTENFIEKSNLIHLNLYDYSNTLYVNMNTLVEIGCKQHGVFSQKPKYHIRGHGCPKCNNSKGEIEIRKYLEKHNIDFIQEKKFDNLVNKLLRFDFYLNHLNICIEYDGIQHFESIKHFGGENYFIKLKERDLIKNEFCKINNIKLLRISYKHNITKELKCALD